MTRFVALVGVVLALVGGLTAAATSEQSEVEHWRQQRVTDLTGEHGWLTLAGLLWLDPGDNSLRRLPSNPLVLNHPALAPEAGKFVLNGSAVHFIADPGSGLTHSGQ